MANTFKRFYQGVQSGLRSFTQTFHSSGSMNKSVWFNLASGVNLPDEKYMGIVYACIDAIIQQTCQATPKLVHYASDGSVQRDFDHPLIQLLHKPNSQQTWRDLMRWTVGYREVCGNAYWYLQPSASGSRPVTIFVLDPKRVRIVFDSEEPYPAEKILKYKYRTPFGFELEFEPDQIVSFPHFSPYSQTVGIGPMQAAWLEQENDLLAQQFNNKTLKNGAMLSGILSTDQQLTDETAERVRQNWSRTYEGTDNYGKTAVLEAGLKYERLSLTLEDMAFYEGREDARKAIMQIFRVPPMLLGTSDTITRANAEASIYSFASMRIQPMLEEIFERINMFVLPKFGLNPTKDKLEFTSVVPEDREQQLKEDVELAKIDAFTRNEIRSRRNLAPLPWGDEPIGSEKSAKAEGSDAEDGLLYDTELEDDDFEQETPKPEKYPKKKNKEKKEKSKRNESDTFNHEAYQAEFEKLDRSLVRAHRKTVQKAYDEAADAIVTHVSNYWPDPNRSLSAIDLRVVKRAMPGALNSIMSKIKNLIHAGISRILSEGVHKASNLTYSYVLGSEGSGMYLDNPQAVDWAMEHGLEDAESISQTMKSVAQDVISQGIIDGWSIDIVSRELKEKFADMTDWKAEQIARTETHKAMSYASHQTAIETGLDLYKSWSDSGDDRVCEHCQANTADGWIPMYQSYSGGEMSPEDEHPNGRCCELFEPADWHKD